VPTIGERYQYCICRQSINPTCQEFTVSYTGVSDMRLRWWWSPKFRTFTPYLSGRSSAINSSHLVILKTCSLDTTDPSSGLEQNICFAVYETRPRVPSVQNMGQRTSDVLIAPGTGATRLKATSVSYNVDTGI
jgi:hypothetical protein